MGVCVREEMQVQKRDLVDRYDDDDLDWGVQSKGARIANEREACDFVCVWWTANKFKFP